tara:strand:- start:40 stop:213 length:174 start_codon:yes stop_codon:yes gene_type:complete
MRRTRSATKKLAIQMTPMNMGCAETTVNCPDDEPYKKANEHNEIKRMSDHPIKVLTL